jgi:hypothetical protein
MMLPSQEVAINTDPSRVAARPIKIDVQPQATPDGASNPIAMNKAKRHRKCIVGYPQAPDS